MGDLISREQSVKALRNYAEQKFAGGEVALANGILKAVNFLEKEENVLTAYDVEKVVAELGKHIERTFHNSLSGSRIAGVENNAYHNALKIVRNGGKE